MDSPRRSRNRAACRRCQRRKIRCDGDLPRCASCRKANAACVNDGKQEVNRTYIANLQKRVQWLESLVKERDPTVQLEDGPQLDLSEISQLGPTEENTQLESTIPQGNYTRRSITPHHEQPGTADPQSSRTHSRPAHEIGLVSLSSGEPRYIGPSSGYFLANLIFSRAGRRTGPSGNHGNGKNPISLSSEFFNSPAPLPSFKEDAAELTSKYFTSVHLVYPFLHQPSHMTRLERMYSNEALPNPADAFHVYMVLAIAASDVSRRFRIPLPAEGYYTAATQYFERACGDSSLEGLQSLLLLMVYGLHNPSCDINVWSLNYQCLGSLIDLGLQRDVRASSTFSISFLEQEMRTRIFWVVYSFDRTLGTMMGRPIGVRDEACELRLPSDVSDVDLSESVCGESSRNRTISHMTFSIHLFKLARINSEIKYVMHSICRDPPRYAYPPVPDIHLWQKEMIERLQTWLAGIPNGAAGDPITKICETKYHEMMILVLRPSPGIPEPSEEMLERCFRHAVDLLRGFGGLYRQEALLYSRLTVHSVFLSTLIMLHCLWKLPHVASGVQIDEVVADTSISLNILSSIGEYWAEAKRARDCIHELSGATVQRLIKMQAWKLLHPRRGKARINQLPAQEDHGGYIFPMREWCRLLHFLLTLALKTCH
ncbi:Transcription factor, fungi [Penicillium italicum]|uniref:Transcription factor, fungi n=1 Tax=Penicillium italicum TaxID=40296 RepID=A0A0A2L4T6_PENIT|nr:Transcription factor, fungi [Penicillium italicum]